VSESHPASLLTIYDQLYNTFGPRYWWPAESRLEIIIGAVLTQGVSWRNVEKAIGNLKNTGNMDFNALLQMNDDVMSGLLHPAGYHRQKTRKLKTLLGWIDKRFEGDIDAMFNGPTAELRRELLNLWGIGPETADSILLYAGGHPVFVVDAYTQRIFSRMGLVEEELDYQALQNYFQENLPPQAELYNEYHALLVTLGANFCRKRGPRCGGCPVASGCRYNEQENNTRR
jgi:endonuclease-3 related protein